MIVDDYFFLKPDWGSLPVLSRIWRTNILSSLTKREQRSALKSYPIKRFSFAVTPHSPAENSYIIRKLYKAKNKIFGVPLWVDRCLTTQIVDSGTGVTFTVDDNSNRLFEVGAPLVFLQDQDNYEVKNIVAVNSNAFEVDSSFTGTWPSGTDVYPVIQGRLLTSSNLTPQTTYGHGRVKIEVNEDFDEDITRTVLSGSSFSTYRGYPVFNVEPNWASGLKSKIVIFPDVFVALGKSLDYSFVDEGIITNNFEFIFYSKADLYDFMKFFDEQMGRWGQFWYPSWQDDFVITSVFDSADTVLNIEDIEWGSYWADTQGIGRFIYILLPDGTEIIRKILSAPSSTQLQLDAALGTTITSLTGILACFLCIGRFNNDRVDFKFSTENVTSTTVELATLLGSNVITTTTTV